MPTKTGGEKLVKSLFFDDTQIPLGDQVHYDWVTNLFLCGLAWTMVWAWSINGNGLLVYGAILLHLMQCCETFNCDTMKYLKGIKSMSQVRAHINGLKQTAPYVGYRIMCYHWRRGKNTKKKVPSFRASDEFHYDVWTDTSPDITEIEHVKNLKLIRLNFTKNFKFSPEASFRLSQQAKVFFSVNNKDKLMDRTIEKEISGFSKKIVVYNDKFGSMPWYANKGILYIMAGLSLSWLQRAIFIKCSTRINFEL
jgi:hypothetical protein